MTLLPSAAHARQVRVASCGVHRSESLITFAAFSEVQIGEITLPLTKASDPEWGLAALALLRKNGHESTETGVGSRL